MTASTPPPAPPAYAIALRSDDVNAQNDGVSAAISLGGPAVPTLMSLLGEPGVAHAQVMYALAEIADPRALPAFTAGMADADERVRAQAARGLARISDASAVSACLQALNDDPDPLHNDQTPAVQALGGLGLAAVPGLLDHMASLDAMSRLRAQRAFELVLARRHGYQPGHGFPSPQAEAAMRAEWSAHGDYAYNAPAAKRATAIRQWRQWLATAGKQP